MRSLCHTPGHVRRGYDVAFLKIALLKVQELNSMSAVVLTNLLLPEHASVSSV